MRAKDVSDNIVCNAWKILEKLATCKETGFNDLQIRTKLDDMSFYMAVGYLMREEKVSIFMKNDIMKIRFI
jgi:hypothetical protein